MERVRMKIYKAMFKLSQRHIKKHGVDGSLLGITLICLMARYHKQIESSERFTSEYSTPRKKSTEPDSKIVLVALSLNKQPNIRATKTSP